MRRVHKVLFVFLTIQISALGVAGSLWCTYQSVLSNAVDPKLISGVLKVREAETEGAPKERIADFSKTLNLVLELLEKAEEEKTGGNFESAQASVFKAESMLVNVVEAAEREKLDAANRNQQQKTIAIILVPLLSLIVTFVGTRTLGYLRKRSLERLFRMKIQVRKEDEYKT